MPQDPALEAIRARLRGEKDDEQDPALQAIRARVRAAQGPTRRELVDGRSAPRDERGRELDVVPPDPEDRFAFERSLARGALAGGARLAGGTAALAGDVAVGIPTVADVLPPVRRLRDQAQSIATAPGRALLDFGGRQFEKALAETPIGSEPAVAVAATAGEVADFAIPAGLASRALRQGRQAAQRLGSRGKSLDDVLDEFDADTFAPPSLSTVEHLPERFRETARRLQFEFVNSLAGIERFAVREIKKGGLRGKIAQEIHVASQWARAATAMAGSAVEWGTRRLVSGAKHTADDFPTHLRPGERLLDITDDLDSLAENLSVDPDRLRRHAALLAVHDRNLSVIRQNRRTKAHRALHKQVDLVDEGKSSKGFLTRKDRDEFTESVRETIDDLIPRAGRRDKELMALPAEIKVSESRSRRVVDSVRKRYGDSLDPVVQRYREWSWRANIEPLIEAGVFSPGEAARMRELGGSYAHFRRAVIDEFGERGREIMNAIDTAVPIKGKRVKRGILDSSSKLDDLWTAEAERSYRVWVFANEQKTRNLLADLADESPVVAREIKRAETTGPPTPTRFHQRKKGDNDTFTVYRNGVAIQYEAPKDVIRSLQYMKPQDAGVAMNIARGFTDVFRSSVTLTLGFLTRNPLRDALQGFVHTRNGLNPLSMAEVLSKDPFNRISRATGKSIDELWDEFLASPGPHATMVRIGPQQVEGQLTALDRVIRERRLSKGQQYLRRVRENPLYALGTPIRAPISVLKKASAALERPTRFAEFALARKAGKSIGEAGLDASEVTLNFLRAGRAGRQWNMVEAFSNAMLQDPSRFVRSFRERPFSAAMAASRYMVLPAIANYLANRNNPDFHNMEEWERVLFLQVGQRGEKGEGGRFNRFPMPPGTLSVVFSYYPQKLLEFIDTYPEGRQWLDEMTAGLFGEGEDPDSSGSQIFSDMSSEMVGQTPLRFIPGIGDVGGDRQLGDSVIELNPNATQPILELLANRVPFFAGRPAVPANLQRLPQAEQITERTSAPAKAIAGMFNRTLERTGLGEHTTPEGRMEEGLIGDASPAAMDFLIQQYLGGLGRDFAQAVSPPTPGRFPGVPEALRNVPIANTLAQAFTSTSPVGPGSKPVRRFYNISERVERADAGYRKQSSTERRRAYLQEYPEAAFGKDWRQWRAEMSQYMDSLNQAILDEDYDKIEEMNQKITAEAVKILDVFETEFSKYMKKQ